MNVSTSTRETTVVVGPREATAPAHGHGAGALPAPLPDLDVHPGLMDVEAAPLPGDDTLLPASPWAAVGLWAGAGLVVSVFIGLPLVVVLTGLLGSALPAVVAAAALVAVLGAGLRLLLATISRTTARGSRRRPV